MSQFFKLALICAVKIVHGETIGNGSLRNDTGCQHKSTLGRDYRGAANTTVTGIPCQKWSDSWPIDHEFTYVGDHNFCRNPSGTYDDKVWCVVNINTTSSTEPCSVPFCPLLKMLDFSQDGDWKRDADKTYTHASLYKEDLPPSFTICLSFFAEYFGEVNSPLFLLLDDDNETWLYVELWIRPAYTEFTIRFNQTEGGITARSPALFFPMQWLRVCFSLNASTSMTYLLVNGDPLVEAEMVVDNAPRHLNMLFGWGREGGQESSGKFTDVNIFSTVPERMEEMTMTETSQCGLAGDFVNWEEANWTLHSMAEIIWEDSARGPCRRASKMQVFPMSVDDYDHQSQCMELCEKFGGRSPPVRTFEEWQTLHHEVQQLRIDPVRRHQH